MTVNPNLAALMRVIEDNQDKMPEGEYLEAMNALGALHREIPAPMPSLAAVVAAAHVPFHSIPFGHPPPSYEASVNLFARPMFPPGMEEDWTEQRAWQNTKTKHPDPYVNSISSEEWISLPYETRYQLLREATEYYISTYYESVHVNPNPELCPFIARHSVGIWKNDGESQWECVCGYTGKVKNWKKHEESDRHQDWAKHRTVSRNTIKKMKSRIAHNDGGEYYHYISSGSPADGRYSGGIRFYPITQERNEWTHPELFADFHRSADPANGKWFVHTREICARQYME